MHDGGPCETEVAGRVATVEEDRADGEVAATALTVIVAAAVTLHDFDGGRRKEGGERKGKIGGRGRGGRRKQETRSAFARPSSERADRYTSASMLAPRGAAAVEASRAARRAQVGVTAPERRQRRTTRRLQISRGEKIEENPKNPI